MAKKSRNPGGLLNSTCYIRTFRKASDEASRRLPALRDTRDATGRTIRSRSVYDRAS